jgi:hypothetical protein
MEIGIRWRRRAHMRNANAADPWRSAESIVPVVIMPTRHEQKAAKSTVPEPSILKRANEPACSRLLALASRWHGLRGRRTNLKGTPFCDGR